LCAQQDSVITPTVEKMKVADTVKASKHSPTTAMLLSIIPGGGQIYNKKYWKLPIVYGLIGTSGYFIYRTANRMVLYRNEYINRHTEGNEALIRPELAQYSDENIIELKNTSRRYMEISIGITAILYALNIVDAMVDAHFYDFDISDDLSLRVSPELIAPNMAFSRPAYGITLNLKW
jgi:hypothetical protein